MATRPSTRRRKPGVGPPHNRRQPLLRSESVASPRTSDTIFKTTTNSLIMKPLGLMKDDPESGLPDVLSNKEVQVEKQDEDPDPFYVTNPHYLNNGFDNPETEDENDNEFPKFQKKPLTAMQYLKELRQLQISDFHGEIRHRMVNDLRVPKSITFAEDESGLKCKIPIQNISWLNITYNLKSSSLCKFRINSSTGWIPARSKVTVEIKTRAGWVKDFTDIVNENFVIFATPVFKEDQLEQHLLEIYWKVFDSDYFPYNMAERHMIKTIIPQNKEKYSMLGWIAMKCQPKKKEIEHNFEPVDAETFHTIWELNGDTWAQNLVMHCQYCQFLRNSHIREVKYQDSKKVITLTAGGLILLGSLLLYGFNTTRTCPFGLLELRNIFEWLLTVCYVWEEPVPPPAWYEWFYFWKWNWGNLSMISLPNMNPFY